MHIENAISPCDNVIAQYQGDSIRDNVIYIHIYMCYHIITNAISPCDRVTAQYHRECDHIAHSLMTAYYYECDHIAHSLMIAYYHRAHYHDSIFSLSLS